MRLSESTKQAVMGNIELVSFCKNSGISLPKLQACSIERMGENYVFVLSKGLTVKSSNTIKLDKDIDTQPDVVLIMKYHNGGFIFETTDKTLRVINN